MGIDLLPVLMEISVWGDNYFQIPAPFKEKIKQAMKNKKDLTKSLLARAKTAR
jgi:hypothetical protein